MNIIEKDNNYNRHDFVGFEYGTLFRVDDGIDDFIAMYVTDDDKDYLLDMQNGILYDDIKKYKRIGMVEADLVITNSFSY